MQCNGTVYEGRWGLATRKCSKPALAGSKFCATHDPEYIADRDAEKRRAETAERDRRIKNIDNAATLQQLFTDERFRPHVDAFYRDYRGKSVPHRNGEFTVTFWMTAEQIQELAKRLGGSNA